MAINNKPTGKFWVALGNKGGEPLDHFCELADNSIDANASEVRIKYKTGKSGVFEISDDGDGCGDLVGMFSPGHSDKSSGSGRYGNGVKGSTAYFGTHFNVLSNDGDKTRQLTYDIKMDIDNDEWGVGGNVVDNPIPRERGTTITVKRVRSGRTSVSKVRKELSKSLYPAIEKGLAVYYNGERVSPFVFEYREGTHRVTDYTSVRGYKCTIEVGLRADSFSAEDTGWHIHKNNRVLRSFLCSKVGLQGIRDLIVKVTLHDPEHKNHWPLDPDTKSTFADVDDMRELQAEVSRVSGDLVDEVVSNKRNEKLDGMLSMFERNLNNRYRQSDNGDSEIVDDESGNDIVIEDNKRDGPRIDEIVIDDPKSKERRGRRKNGNECENDKDNTCGYCLEYAKLRDFSWRHEYNNTTKELKIVLDESQLSSGGDRTHAGACLLASALSDAEDSLGFKLHKDSHDIDDPINCRHKRWQGIVKGGSSF